MAGNDLDTEIDGIESELGLDESGGKKKSKKEKPSKEKVSKKKEASEANSEDDFLEVVQVPVSKLSSPKNKVRVYTDPVALAELKASVKQYGIWNPLHINAKNEVVAGGRRLEVAKELKIKEVPCIIIEFDESAHEFEYGAMENLHRDNLTVVEEARVFKGLLDKKAYTTQKELAGAFNKTENYVSGVISLLQLDKPTLKKVAVRQISRTAAMELVKVSPKERKEVAKGSAKVKDIKEKKEKKQPKKKPLAVSIPVSELPDGVVGRVAKTNATFSITIPFDSKTQPAGIKVVIKKLVEKIATPKVVKAMRIVYKEL